MIIMISSKQGCGKTTLANNLSKVIKNAVTVKFAQPVYDVHNLIYDYLSMYDIPKKEKDGDLLQLIGEHFRSKVDSNIWSNITRKYVDNLIANGMTVICDDCRHENEFKAFRDAVHIRLECDEETRKKRTKVWRNNTNHPSEIGLDSYSKNGNFDYYIHTGIRSEEETFTMAMNFIERSIDGTVSKDLGDYYHICDMWLEE